MELGKGSEVRHWRCSMSPLGSMAMSGLMRREWLGHQSHQWLLVCRYMGHGMWRWRSHSLQRPQGSRDQLCSEAGMRPGSLIRKRLEPV